MSLPEKEIENVAQKPSKRSAVSSLDKLEKEINGNAAISVNLQKKLLKHINTINKKIKPVNQQRVKVPGASQFEKKMTVSADMCVFAGWEHGCCKSRVEVTKAIWDYVTEKGLRFEENKRICVLDDTLKQLLKVDEAKVSYPQLQKYVGNHLTKIEE